MPGNDSGPGGDQGQPTVEQREVSVSVTRTRSARDLLEADPTRHAAMEELDDHFVAGSWRRGWSRDVRELRRRVRAEAPREVNAERSRSGALLAWQHLVDVGLSGPVSASALAEPL